MTNNSFLAAGNGPLLQGELVPLNNKGKLRVSYNWLYSALNCNPNDSSPFVWTISKVDDTHISLSPRDSHSGMTLYASIRDDLSWYAQVQAPFSADWIRAVGRDEICALESQDLLIMSFKGFNGQY